MKNKNSIFLAVLFFFLYVLFVSWANQKSQWQGSIEEKDGVIVVKNPKNPASPPGGFSNLILTEDLCIGDEEGVEDFIFSQIRSIQVDEEENIYVLDSKEVCVKVFDKHGTPIRTFGKKGQGPGEMQLPTRMHMMAGKEILIYDGANNRLSFYSRDGKCLREISAGKYRFSRTIPDSQGNIITQLMVPGDTFVNEIKKFDPNLNPIMKIKDLEEEIDLNVINLVSPTLNVRVMHNDNIVWGYPLKYEIIVVNPEGKTIRKIVKDYDPVKITKEKQEEIIKEVIGDREIPSNFKLKFPKTYYPYYFFICGDIRQNI